MINKKESFLYRKAQISVFIILAILIAIVLIVFFVNRGGLTSIIGGESPISQIEKCMQDNVKEGLGILSSQGGDLEPKNYYLYQNDKVAYLCYTEEYYKPCVMQKPLLKQSIEDELKNYLEPTMNRCLESVKSSFERKGYSLTYKNPEITVQIIPENIVINSNVQLTVSKENTESYQNIKTSISSSMYGFIMTSSSISNWEARYGDSETLAYMLYYPSLKVEKKIRSDGSRIYILTDRNSLEQFKFAIRSMAFPSGITGN
ncbi:MAG: hypothetical protein WC979_04295 [Candidatus Pacearchaeota archaeon]|jgi:hypothetical protein